ncbi:glycosyltransferase [Kushneria marisflavi]|nr:glycosyltransferase [Kushneria marisflavi]
MAEGTGMFSYYIRQKRKIKSIIYSGYMRALNLLRKQRHAGGDGHLIVSLTTHPPRISDVYITIESILLQHVSNFEVHLYISKQDMMTIGSLPATLQRQVDRGLRIITTTEDYRSYDKLVHVLKENPDATIVTADDDVIYPRDWLGRLLEGAKKHPDCVICHRGHLLRESSPGSGHICYQTSRAARQDPIERPLFNLMPTGNGGVLYPPGSLDPMVIDHTAFQELAPNADDIWFKMASLKRGTRCFRINAYNANFLPTRAAHHDPLHKENVKGDGNNQKFDNCLKRHPELMAKLLAS